MLGELLLDLFELGPQSSFLNVFDITPSLASFLIDNQGICEFIGDNYNSAVYIGDTNYVNDITVMANNPRVYEINSALEIDFSGQVVAESEGLNIFSCVGEQVDFLALEFISENGNLLFVLRLRYTVYRIVFQQFVCLRDTIFVVQMFFSFVFPTFSVVFCGLKGNELTSLCLDI